MLVVSAAPARGAETVSGWQASTATALSGGGPAPHPSTRASPWRPLQDLDAGGLQEGGPTWLRTTIPSSPSLSRGSDSLLVFRSYTAPFVVYVDDREVYRFEAPPGGAAGRVHLHIVPVPPGVGDRRLTVWLEHGRPAVALSGEWLLVPRDQLAAGLTRFVVQPLGEGTAAGLLGSILCCVGLLALAVGLRVPRHPDWLSLSFGGFALLYGARLLAESHLLLLFGVPLVTLFFVQSAITYAIHVPAWSFFRQLLPEEERSRWLDLLVAVALLFAVAGPLADLVQNTPFTITGTLNNLLVLGALVVVGVHAFRARHRFRSELRTLALGLFALALTAINDNLVSLGWLPWSLEVEPLGFSLFVVTMGLVTVRRIQNREARLRGLEADLDVARRIQSSLLPDRLPTFPGIRLDARFLPAAKVAGDLYDVRPLGADRFGLLVADVAGHGVPAALVASMVKAAFFALEQHAAHPAQLLAQLNRQLCDHLDRGFVTAVYAHVDLDRREILLASGGHPRPLLRRADGGVEELAAEGPLLGRFPEASYGQTSRSLERGDTLLFYTDGIVEATGRQDEMFGEERLSSLLRDVPGADASSLLDRILERLGAWTAAQGRSAEQEDDCTLLQLDVLARS